MTVQVNKSRASLLKLPLFLISVLLILCVSACGSKLAGTFVGPMKLHSVSYATGSYVANDETSENVTATLASKSSYQYNLTFDEKSPLKCQFLLDNRNLEDNNPDNDGELTVRGTVGQSCELRDKNGKMQSVKVVSIEGGTIPSLDVRFSIKLTDEGSTISHEFTFEGKRQ